MRHTHQKTEIPAAATAGKDRKEDGERRELGREGRRGSHLQAGSGGGGRSEAEPGRGCWARAGRREGSSQLSRTFGDLVHRAATP